MSIVNIEWRPRPTELRTFGLWMCALCAMAAAACYWIKDAPRLAIGVAAFGTLTAILSVVLPRAALRVYWMWMGLALAVGYLMTPVLLALFYYGVVTPIGLLARITGRDRLHLRRRSVATYWADAAPPQPRERYERQF
jgi:hypothetical protein